MLSNVVINSMFELLTEEQKKELADFMFEELKKAIADADLISVVEDRIDDALEDTVIENLEFEELANVLEKAAAESVRQNLKKCKLLKDE